MADICAWCQSTDIQHGLHQYQCHVCGQVSASDGSKDIPTSMLNEGLTVADVEAERSSDE